MPMQTPSHTPHLGLIVQAVCAIFDGYDRDPMSDHVGYHPDPTPEAEHVVRQFGFTNLTHLYNVVAYRTSDRWAHFNLPF